MKEFDAALFDLDGTLLDSLGVWADIDRSFFAGRGLTMPEDYTACIRGLSFLQTAEYTVKRFGLPETPEQIASVWHDMCAREYVHRVMLKPGVAEYLRRLKEQGALLAVVTTLTPALYEPALKRNGVYALFDVFVTTDESGKNKESGEIYRLAARKLNVEPARCMVYEDIPEGLIGAKKAGMRAALVYDVHNASSLDEARALCDKYIKSYMEI